MVIGIIFFLLNARCAMVLHHKTLFVPVCVYVSETMIWKEKSRIREVQMKKMVFLSIRRMDKVPNVWINEFCGVVKELRKVFM